VTSPVRPTLTVYRLYAGSPEDSMQAEVTHFRRVPYAERTMRRWFLAALWEAGRRQRRADLPEHRRMLRWCQRKYRGTSDTSVRMYRGLIRNPEVRVTEAFDAAVDLFCERHGFTRIVPHSTTAVSAWGQCYPAYKPFGSR
jgi:hypothetical protein